MGKVQEAETGTLLLDEVGDLSADAQARLLRFLNDRSYERLGEAKERTAMTDGQKQRTFVHEWSPSS